VILHPGALALIVGSSVVLALLLYASPIAIAVIRRWDLQSSSEGQLALERRTHLVSTIAAAALGFEVVSTFLFLYTLDDIHPLFAGAMCAIGSLNANPVGWQVLIVKLVILFAAPLWIAVNSLDQRAGDFPVIRSRSLGLLVLAPLVALDLALQIRYFAGLRPEVITSCCGALFSVSAGGVASELAALPALATMAVFYGTAGLLLVLNRLCAWRPSTIARVALAAMAVGFLVVALASIVSFLSPYVYELPTHHCPFDMLQASSGFVGYPVYLALYVAVLFGILPAVGGTLRRHPSLSALVASAEPGWLRLSVAATLVLTALTTWEVVFSDLSMRGY